MFGYINKKGKWMMKKKKDENGNRKKDGTKMKED